jgi:hypothetical protein
VLYVWPMNRCRKWNKLPRRSHRKYPRIEQV